MWKFLYEILINPLGLPIDPIWEYVIILVVGEIAHEIAYWVSPGGKEFGSAIYWTTKFLCFIAMWAILYGIIAAIKFVIAYWIWFTIGGTILLVITTIIIIRFKKKRATKQKEISN